MRYSPLRSAWAVLLLLLLACQKPQQESPSTTDAVHFTDIADTAGITFRHSNGKTGRYYFIETVASGGGFIDYDNDGDLDLYLLNGCAIPGYQPSEPLSSKLYRNDGSNRFTDVTLQAGVSNAGHYGLGLAVGDYDNDGDQDLFVTNFGENILYRNNGDGTFTDATAIASLAVPRLPYFSTSAAFVDYDRDGDLDLFVCGYVDFTFDTNKKCVRDGLQSYCDPDAYNALPDLLYRNNGDGSFTDVSVTAGIADTNGKGLGVVCGDYDNDGWPDIYVANDRTPNLLYHNNADGTFTEVALMTGVAYGEDGVARAGMGVDFGDYDGNGAPDLYITNFSMEPNSLFRNNANGTFTETTFPAGLGNPTLLFLAFGTAFFDYDSDGWLDLFAANGHVIDNIEKFEQNVTYEETNQLFHNTGDGKFEEVSAIAGAPFKVKRVHRGAAFGDMDNDGDIDVLVTSVNGPVALLRNDSSPDNRKLLVKAIGVKSNRDGIGTRMTAYAGDLKQTRDVKSAYSYMSSNDFRIHFGLAEHTVIDSLTVNWPSGTQETLHRLPVDQQITIREGEGVVSQTPLPAR